MSVSHKSESWVDRWFPLLVIAFGLLFLALLGGLQADGLKKLTLFPLGSPVGQAGL